MSKSEDVDLAKKNVVVVLGMSRSGTSAVARSLKALGVDLGQKLLPGDIRNPKGFWEDADILYAINRNVSRVLNYPWMTVGSMDKWQAQQHPALQAYYQYAQQLLQKRMATTQYWGFKDPRTVTILPFWHAVFEALKLQDSYVIVVRNPLAAAHSNQKFSGDDLEMGLLLWLIHLFPAIEATHGKKRVVVSYEHMLQGPRWQLQRMKQALAIPFDLDETEVGVYADEFIDKNLRHNIVEENELRSNPVMAVVPLCLRMYELLLKLAKDEMLFESEAFQSAWADIKAEFERQYPLYHYARSLLERSQKLESDMRSIRKSLPWKLIYPLRVVNDILRVYRRKRKEKRRLEGLYA